MSDFLKKAASLIFNVEDSDEESKQKENPSAQQQSSTGAAQQAAASAPGPAATTSYSDNKVADEKTAEKFRAYFKDLYDRANMQGPDFYEFNNMTEAMGQVIADDVKYPSVFAGFGGALTKEKLLSSAQQYLDLVQRDVKDFDNSLQQAVKAKVSDRRSLIEAKAQEIKKMQEKIAALNNEIIELNKLAQDEETRLQAEKQAYHQQSEQLQLRIKSGVEKINRYIK